MWETWAFVLFRSFKSSRGHELCWLIFFASYARSRSVIRRETFRFIPEMGNISDWTVFIVCCKAIDGMTSIHQNRYDLVYWHLYTLHVWFHVCLGDLSNIWMLFNNMFQMSSTLNQHTIMDINQSVFHRGEEGFDGWMIIDVVMLLLETIWHLEIYHIKGAIWKNSNTHTQYKTHIWSHQDQDFFNGF